MNEAATDVIAARARDTDTLTTMVVWSIAAHIVVTVLIMFIPAPEATPPPRTVMMISLGGAEGPRTGGMTQMGSRPVQAPPPEEPVRRAESAPAPTPPAMTLPDPKARTRPETAKPRVAPPAATSKTAATGAKPNEGTTKSSPQERGQGFGLSSGGGGGGELTVDAADFCCPGYLIEMRDRIEANWRRPQGPPATTTMQFTVLSDGTIRDEKVEKSSGFIVLDTAAQRALTGVRLAPLPRAYTNPTLTVHLEFVVSR